MEVNLRRGGFFLSPRRVPSLQPDLCCEPWVSFFSFHFTPGPVCFCLRLNGSPRRVRRRVLALFFCSELRFAGNRGRHGSALRDFCCRCSRDSDVGNTICSVSVFSCIGAFVTCDEAWPVHLRHQKQFIDWCRRPPFGQQL